MCARGRAFPQSHTNIRLRALTPMFVRYLPLFPGKKIIAGALGLTRFLSGFLYQVKPVDPLRFAELAVLLGGISLLASYIPAWRATRVNPMVALRYE
jgi:ABC-type antimicrobial peptide transport system permease subunit